MLSFFRSLTKQVKDNFKYDTLSGIFLGIYVGLAAPLFTIIARKVFNASPFWLSVMVLATSIGGIFSFLFSAMVKEGQEMKYYATAYGIIRALYLLFFFINNGTLFCLNFTIIGFLSAVICTQYNIIIQKCYPANIRGKLMSYNRIVLNIFLLLSTLLGTVLADRTILGMEGWRFIFGSSGIILLICNGLFAKMKYITDEVYEQENVWGYLKNFGDIFIHDMKTNVVLLGMFFFFFSSNLTLVAIPIFQNDILHMKTGMVSAFAFINTVFIILSLPIWGRYLDKIDSIIMYVFVQGFLMILNLFYFFCPTENYFLFLSGGYVFQGIATGGAEVGWFLVILWTIKENKNQVYQAFHLFNAAIRAIFCLFFCGYIVSVFEKGNYDIRILFLIGFLAYVLGIITFLCLKIKPKKVIHNNTRLSS